jgi:transcription-repair coupling factor (superfamily II helicase)
VASPSTIPFANPQFITKRTAKTPPPPGANLLQHTAATAPFKARLKQIGEGSVVFDHIARPAQAFVAALVARHFLATASGGHVWVLADDLRSQERLAEGLRLWHDDALFFPELELPSIAGALPDPEIMAERLAVLESIHGERSSDAKVVVALAASLDETVPSPESLASRKLSLVKGEPLDIESLTARLVEAGYENAALVAERGQFALRGGIIDIFSLHSFAPLRIELFDDEIESVREFDVDSQISTSRPDRCSVLLGEPKERVDELRSYIEPGDLVIEVGELGETETSATILITENAEDRDGEEDFSVACHDAPFGAFEAGDFILQQARRDLFAETLSDWHADGWLATIYFNNEGEIERFRELVAETGVLPAPGFPDYKVGTLQHGFTVPSAKTAAVSASELFGRYGANRARRAFNRERKESGRRRADDFRELVEGDRVVHLDHGIGIYDGLIEMDGEGGAREEVLVLNYADDAKLYVPLEQAHLVSRYVGSGKTAPPADKLGGGRWARRRETAEKSILDYAAQLLKTNAERAVLKSYSHPPDTGWQVEFENSFIYRETPDQIRAIEDSKADMESGEPMDRLICGDVGFGKTEIAIRASFKAVMGGKQVAFLCPTTVLAQQHYDNLRQRFSDYPIQVDLLSRFRTPTQQRKTLRRALAGDTDIIVGTHRLISKDVAFKNLGLAIIDEEQRFGVQHKERFKELFQLVDVLTLSATPIPRTLYLSLMGVKDMSTIDTPPAGRSPVATAICPYDERTIRTAIKRELDRRGQVFFLHNRVGTIGKVKKMIEGLVPGARVSVGHGQMGEGMLEDIMHSFVAGDIDVLVCTTIIESGIDIPNANTIIIDRADRFGLADLYQLRGRVGRAGHKAYAILMLPPDLLATGDARKRINAIRQYTELGSGFKIAMRDLEIRGAGNLLGTQQSGHISAVGFDLYCKLLKQSVERLKGNTAAGRAECSLRIDFLSTNEAAYLESPEGSLPAFLPSAFLPEARLRISAYRQLAELETIKELKALIREWRDRFGSTPDPADYLLRCTELKLAAAAVGIESIEILGNKLMLTRNGEYVLIGGKFPRLGGGSPEDRLITAVDLVKKF